MDNFLTLATGVDTTPLLLSIKRRPELWKADDYLRNYPQGPFKEVESILLRFPPITVVELEEDAQRLLADRRYDPHECMSREEMRVLPEAHALAMMLMARVEGERLGRVMINKIVPGGRIFPHADTPEHADYYTRFHVCLYGLPGATIRCGDERRQFRTGDVFWFNNKLEHEVVNNSAEERISMVVDIRTSRP